MVEEAPHQYQRPPVEELYREELERLRAEDSGPTPPGWKLSPRSIRDFVLGDRPRGLVRKFVGRTELVDAAVTALATHRGAMLIGEPGTAKSWLSELLAAAISGSSTLVVQGGSATSAENMLYSWNRAILAEEGPTPRALIMGPLLRGLREGAIVRLEELSRCQSEVQDSLLSALSDRVVTVPQIGGAAGVFYARPGFNVIGTANTRDRGLHQMSEALKRRMSFTLIEPIQNEADEVSIVAQESGRLLRASGVPVDVPDQMVHVLVTMFRDLRSGYTADGRTTDRLSSPMSTAEAVSAVHALGVRAHFLREGDVVPRDVVEFVLGAAVKDDQEDRRRMRHYFDREVARRSAAPWPEVYAARDHI